MSEWKPGDVAMCMYGRVFCAEGGWFFDDGSGPSENPRDLRPLAVIDPEDREAVERLASIVDEWWGRVPYADMRKDGDLTTETAMQAALREFANPTPPKPEEPQRIGARVEEANGVRYTRFSDSEAHSEGDWINEDGVRVQWDQIAAVRVLSEGVQP